ncbi:helix-turn-helix transcriptional regulator [Leifsonia kafniensis]|uniref:Helix-turn-helix transcriptional regulator n=1 Tax=Leifsonia kafniensis TaxID=475957 RepID=A0ABP7KFA2_9MICO
MYRETPSRIAGATLWSSDSAEVAGETRIIPDGSIDIIWLGDRLIVAGADTHAQVAESRPEFATAGIRFAPGFAPALLGIAAHELTNRRIPLDAIWASSVVGPMRDRLESAGPTDADALALTLEQLVVGRLDALDLSRAHRSRGLLRLAEAGMPAGNIADRLDLSPRQLHRRAIDDFGYGVRTLQRILRFQRAVELLSRGLPLAAVAATTGFADQPHLNREVKAFAGVTPGQLAGASGSAANRSTELPSGSRIVA